MRTSDETLLISPFTSTRGVIVAMINGFKKLQSRGGERSELNFYEIDPENYLNTSKQRDLSALARTGLLCRCMRNLSHRYLC